jgi:hypothetical protein
MITFEICEIPDPQTPELQRRAGGDVGRAIGQDWIDFLRAVSDRRDRSVCVTQRLAFVPLVHAMHVQSRLKLYVLVTSEDEALQQSLATLLEQGPLGAFYSFKKNVASQIPWERLKACCHIVRRERTFASLLKPEDNPAALSSYYLPDPFEPDDNNDYSRLVRFLSSLDEYVVVDIAFEPTDVSEELRASTDLLDRLHAINGSSLHDRSLSGADPVFIGDDARYTPSPLLSSWTSFKRDPLAEDVFRLQKKLNERLTLPHLFFNVRVMSESEVTAQLVASTLASEAFTDGAHRILGYSGQDPRLAETIRCAREGRTVAVSTHTEIFKGPYPRQYRGLSRLAQLATPQELSGLCRLPVGTYQPSLCIRRNTDPPLEVPADLIVIGYDQEVGYFLPGGQYRGVERGISIRALAKHIFACGGTGTGKTTVLIGMMPQLHRFNIPFLVIAPIKRDFRLLIALREHPDQFVRELARILEVYTPGNDSLSPYRFNPLKIIEGISQDEHSYNFHSCLMAAMPFSGPLVPLLAESIEDTYVCFKGRNRWPVIADLIESVDRVMTRAKYVGELDANLRAAIELRIRSLGRGSIGRVLSCSESTPTLEHLMQTPTVIEMEGLPREQASLLTLFILTGVREYAKAR